MGRTFSFPKPDESSGETAPCRGTILAGHELLPARRVLKFAYLEQPVQAACMCNMLHKAIKHYCSNPVRMCHPSLPLSSQSAAPAPCKTPWTKLSQPPCMQLPASPWAAEQDLFMHTGNETLSDAAAITQHVCARLSLSLSSHAVPAHPTLRKLTMLLWPP